MLIAVSFITYLIFMKSPAAIPRRGSPAERRRRRTSQNIREKWGFDDPFYVQYGKMMEGLNGLPGPHSSTSLVLDTS